MAIIRKKKENYEQARRKAAQGQLDDPSALREFARRNGLTVTPLDVEKLAEELGILVEKNPLPNQISGYLNKKDGIWTIGVNSLHHPNRQRFTIAHELAHYCLHRRQSTEFVDKILFRNEDSDPAEREANRFAGELLVPELSLRKLIGSGITKVDELAERFKVSSLALRVRAKQLGMSGHGL